VCVAVWLCVYICTGIGPNMLLARLATKRAKPNGQAVVSSVDQGRALLGELAVEELPGVGWSLRGKLADMGITHVRQVRPRGGGGVGHRICHEIYLVLPLCFDHCLTQLV
jgi:nucleotidyltransferase/DNA polymerase involved in DNA repair